MRAERLTETAPRVLALSEEEAAALTAAGKRLAGSAQYWRNSTEGNTPPERSVIRCDPITRGRYRVTVTEAVGIIALPSLHLIVEPKIPSSHFHYLLRRSPAFPRIEDQQGAAGESSELWDLVANWFVTVLERLLRQGLVADYEELHDHLRHLRGTVQVTETASTYYQGSLSFSCVFDEFGLDSPMNRLLRAAVATIAAATILKPELRKRARRAASQFAGVGELRPGDHYHVPERRSAHYAIGLQLARQVLAATGRTMAAGNAPAWTFLIRTPDLVENAIRNILRNGLHDLVEIKKASLRLTPSHLTLNPDLIFGRVATGDVKYSLLGHDWNRSHLYQAVSFATGYRVPLAAVFGFTSTGTHPPQVQIGPVNVRAFSWLANVEVAPESAEAALLSDAGTWLHTAAVHWNRPGS